MCEFIQQLQPVSQYQYVSVPIPTTPQVTRPLRREKVHYRHHGDTLILPIEAKKKNKIHRGKSTVH
jgi:hypothetical protein